MFKSFLELINSWIFFWLFLGQFFLFESFLELINSWVFFWLFLGQFFVFKSFLELGDSWVFFWLFLGQFVVVKGLFELINSGVWWWALLGQSSSSSWPEFLIIFCFIWVKASSLRAISLDLLAFKGFLLSLAFFDSWFRHLGCLDYGLFCLISLWKLSF